MNRQLKALIIGRFGTQTNFAKIAKEPEPVISRIIRGRDPLSPERALKWSKILGCKIQQINKTLQEEENSELRL